MGETAHQTAHDEEPEPQARSGTLDVAPHLIEALEDLAQLSAGNPDPPIGNLDANPTIARGRHGDAHVHGLVRVLDRVLEQVAEDQLQLLRFAPHRDRICGHETHRIVRQGVANANILDALVEELLQIDPLAQGTAAALLGPGGCQYLLDGMIEPVQILLHALDELAPALGRRIVTPQGVEVESERSEGRLHLMGDRVQKGALPLVQAHFLQQPGAEPRQTHHHEQEEEGPQHEEKPIEGAESLPRRTNPAPEHDLPADGEHQQDQHEDDGDCQGRPDRSALHGHLLGED